MSPLPGCANPADVLAWIECHPALAGYLQIIAVVLAIGGSAWVAWFSTLKPQRDERAHRAKVLRYRLLPSVIEISKAAERVREASREIDYGVKLVEDGEVELAEWALRIDTAIPADTLSELHVLDENTSEAVAGLHYYLSRFNDLVHRNLPLLRSFSDDQLSAHRAAFRVLLKSTEEHAEGAYRLLMGVSDG